MVILPCFEQPGPGFQFSGLYASSETQGQSVGSGEKAGRKFSSTGKRAPGYRLSPNYFQNFKQMPAPDWVQKCFVLLCPIDEQFLLSSFHEFVHDGFFFLKTLTSDNKLNLSFPSKLDWIHFKKWWFRFRRIVTARHTLAQKRKT